MFGSKLESLGIVEQNKAMQKRYRVHVANVAGIANIRFKCLTLIFFLTLTVEC